MLLERDRKLFYLFAVISIAISLLVCIPFSLEKVTLFEIIVKYGVFAIAIAVFTFLCWSAKYRNYRPAVKYTTIVTYLPLFSYSAAVLFNTLLTLVRNHSVYESLKFNGLILGLSVILVALIFLSHSYYKFVIKLSKNEALIADICFAVLGFAYTLCGLLVALDYKKFGGFESKSALFAIIPIILGLAAASLHVLTLKVQNEAKQEYVIKNRLDLYKQWEENNLTAQKIYDFAHADLLETMFAYNLDNLGFEEVEDFEETTEDLVSSEELIELEVKNSELIAEKEELANLNDSLENQVKELENEVDALKARLDEALTVIAESKDKIVDTLQKCAENDADLIMDSLQHSLDVIVEEREAIVDSRKKLEAELEAQKAELQAKIDEHNAKVAAEAKAKEEALEKARLDAERRAKEAEERAKEKKPIMPPFTKFVEYAVSVYSGREDVELSINDKQTLYKFVCSGTPFIVLQKTNNDYRIGFLAKTEEMRELLYTFNGIVTFDKTVEYEKAKYSIQSLKAVYKGDESITFEDIQGLLTNSLQVLLEAEELEAAAIAKEQAAKERAKLAEQALREKERALAKEEAKRQKEAQKEAEEENSEQAA